MNNQIEQKHNGTAIALGFFDGVHRGHGELLTHVVKQSQGAEPVALTFDRHPASYIQKVSVPMLSSVVDRCWAMEQYFGIESVIVADFSRIMSMNWRDFVCDYLIRQLHVSYVVAGHDFRFGYKGEGNAQGLAKICEEKGIQCHIVPPVMRNQQVISSTWIRELIQQGEMAQATSLLGHPHLLSNQVKHGKKIGRSALGFPTVNLEIPPGVITPKFGVYACRVWVEGDAYWAVTNVGIRPTIQEQSPKKVTVEGFMLDFPDQELYGTNLRMEFYHFLRDEEKFDTLEALTAQISRDVETTIRYFRSNPPQSLG